MYISSPPTIDKLKEFSREHLYYEIDMLYGSVRTLLKGAKNPYVFNALLESFVVHASVILDFFYKVPVNPDDAKAVHYVRNVEAWQKVLPPFDRYFVKFNKKRNKEVMHLSYSRLDVPVYDKKWNSPKLVEQLRELIDLFLDHADPDKIHPKVLTLRSK